MKLYLTDQINNVSTLSNVDDDRLSVALDSDVVKPDWANVLHYFKKGKLDKSLIVFIVKYAKELSENNCGDDDSAYPLFLSIITSGEIPLVEFRLLIKSFDYYLDASDHKKWQVIDVSKLESLIDNGAFEYSEEIRNYMFETEAYVYYLTSYKKEFLESLDKVNLTTEHVKKLFAQPEYNLDERLIIANAINENVLDTALTDFICDMLRERKIDMADNKLLKMLEFASMPKNKVFVANMYIEKAVDNLFRIKTAISMLPAPLNELLTSNHPRIDPSEDNVKLLKLLKTGGYITIKSYDKNGEQYLRPYRKGNIEQ